MKKAIQAYAAQKDLSVTFDEREKAIMQKAKIYGSPLFENPKFAKELFSLNPQDDSFAKETQDMCEIILWIQESIEKAQMSKD